MRVPVLTVQGDPVQQALKLLPESTHPVSREVVVAEDTFVADRYPYNERRFSNEHILAFGTDSTLGNMRTFLRLRGTFHPGARVVGVYLALGIAGGSNDAPMRVEIGESKVHVGIWNLRWNNQPADSQVETWFRTDIITRGLWYIYDVTSHFLDPEHPNQLREKVVRIRALQEPASGWKGMWSREGNLALAPRLIVFYYPDRTPPTCTMRPLPDMLYKPVLRLQWSCQDNSQVETMRIILQRRVDNGPWQKIMDRHTYRASLLDLSDLKAYRGHRLSFRVRAVDDRGNVGDWSDPVSTTVNNVPPRMTRADFSPFQWNAFTVHVEHPAPPGEAWVNLYDFKGWIEDKDQSTAIPVLSSYLHNKTLVVTIPRMPESLFGHWVRYRFRLGDTLGNMSEEFEIGPIFVYKFHGRVHIRDILDQPLRARLSLSPEALVYPDGDTTYDVYAWRSRQASAILSSGGFRFSTVPLLFPSFPGPIPAGKTFVLHVGVGNNAVKNGKFSEGLEGWTTAGEEDVFVQYGRLRAGISRLSPSLVPYLIVPTADHTLLLWHKGTVAQIDSRGSITTVLEVPELPNQRWKYWMVPPGQGRTMYALASVWHIPQPAASWYLLRWDRDTGDARFITSTLVYNGKLWDRWQDLDVDESGRPAVLWWNEQEEPHLIYQVLEGDQWHRHAITSSVSAPNRLRLLITHSGVWAFVIKDETLCWYYSPDGHQWEDEVCRNYKAYKLFRAGRLGPFTNNGRVLRLLEPADWRVVASVPNANVTGCPDETIRGIQKRGQFLYSVGWDASGRALPSQKLMVMENSMSVLIWPGWPMGCDGTSYSFYFPRDGKNRLARIWLQPRLVPLLSQSVTIPTDYPVLSLQARFELAQEATAYVTLVPEGNGSSSLTVTLPVTTSAMSHYAVDLSPLAGQKVSLTFSISSTVYPMIGYLEMDDIRIKSVPYEVAVAQRATWLDDRRVLLDVWAYNHRQVPARNVTMSMSWPENMRPLHLPEGITLTQGTQVTIPLGTLEPETTRHLTATFALSGTRPMTATFRARIFPRTADINPKNNESVTILFGREVKRRYLPQVIRR